MLTKLNKRKQDSAEKGLTIIEVMIVLAIAGLILLIVFLAVPALQRSSRNTQRKTDVGRIGSAATTVLSNNNNQTASLTTATLVSEIGAGTLSYYTTSNVSVVAGATAGGVNTTTANTVIVYTGATCNGSLAVTGASTPTTSLAITYSAESGSGTDKLCVQD